MSDDIDTLERRYAAALERYVTGGKELALSDAYELGRQAMADGLGVLDMAILHRAALKALEASAPAAEKARMIDDAADFFFELLSPFEMSFRGYRAANEELRRLNELLELQKTNLESVIRELETFSYSVSHDLRAPLRSINAFSQIVLDENGERLDEDGKRYLKKIRDAALMMAQLIDGLLGLSRVTRAELHRTDVDMSALVHRISERLQLSSPERACTFTIEDGIRSHGDAQLVTVLVENLLANAWKFTSKRPDAEIAFGRMESETGTVYFVCDNGAGFDMAHATKLFGAFERLHSARDFEGTGIGLATVKRVVQRHDGRVWAEGQVGKGATFYFTLSDTP